MIDLRLGDCLTVMGDLADGSIDLVLADLPFGTTRCHWDQVIPFESLWAHYRRLLKPRGAVVLTASQPFTSMLVMSNLEWFKYDWVWKKHRGSGYLNAKKSPIRGHENILVFSAKPGTYNPQMTERTPSELKRLNREVPTVWKNGDTDSYQNGLKRRSPDRASNRFKYPNSFIILDEYEKQGDRGFHPTQKPLALMEYLIKTYSNKGETVLDNTMGSGTTGIACLNTGRDFIGVEKDPDIFAIAQKRIAAELARTALLDGVAS